jgi:hypothetical protein
MARLVLSFLLVGAFWISITGPSSADSMRASIDANCTPADKCCKVCDKGQACGNSCISRSKTCHKGQGCACNASDVCGRQ